MSLPQDGIQFVAKDADKFIRTLDNVSDAYNKTTGSFDDAAGKFATGSNQINQAGQSAASGADSFLGSIGDLTSGFSILDGAVLGAGQKLLDFALSVPGMVVDGLMSIAGAVVDVGESLAGLANEAAQLQGVAAGFGNFAAQTEAGAEAILFSLRAASAGMVSTEDLMTKFNDAAALVSVQFVERLPEGLEILSKVSAATGADLNKLLDSFVTGIGRVSPMILDNLKIQVSQAEATARAAEMFGKEEDALTKVEQQMALTDITLEKLTQKFGGLPDVTQSATANLARIDAIFADIRAQIGSAFLPAWTSITNAVAVLTGGIMDLISEGGALYPVLANLGAIASIVGDGLNSAAIEVVNFVNGAQDSLGSGLSEMVDSALSWGINISTSFAQGLIDGAATALTVAMNFISGMLSGWLAPGSPPKVAPDLPEWGASAMTEYLEGFTQADFGILESLQGPLSKVLDDLEFADLSQEIARAISAGDVGESFFDTLAASAGEFGDEIADLARLEFELVDATDALSAAEQAQEAAVDGVADAQERLDDTMRQVEETDQEVARLTEQYNELLRAGASQDVLSGQLALINAAEQQRDAAIENNRVAMRELEAAEDLKDQRDSEAQAAVDAAKAEVDAAKERLANQEDLVNQLISLSDKAKEDATGVTDAVTGGGAGRGGKAAGAEGVTTPVIDELMPADGLDTAFDFTGGLTNAIENAKSLILEKFGTIFDPIKAIIDEKFGPQSAIGQTWATISDQIKAVWDEKLVPFWEDTLKPAVETVQQAFDNMQTFWETSAIPKLAGEAFGTFIDVVMDLADRIIPFFTDQLLKVSEWFVANGPMIDTVIAAVVDAWDLVAPAFALSWDIIEPILGAIIDTILDLGTMTLQFVTGDWSGAWDTASTIMNNFKDAATQSMINLILGLTEILLSDNWQTFIGTWQDNWDGLFDVLTGFTANVIAQLILMINDISTWFSEQWGTFEAWGRDMIRGFEEGIVGKVEDIITSVSDAIKAAVQAAKDALGMHSPSAVFADMAINSMSSYADTILSSQSLVSDAMAQAFGDGNVQVNPMFAGGAAMAVAEAQPMIRDVSIQIGPNYFQSGDAQQLRQMVRQVMRDELRRN